MHGKLRSSFREKKWATIGKHYARLFLIDFSKNNVESQIENWERVAPGEDPPDFYLTSGGNRFAVEITSTKILREAHTGIGHIDEQTYECSNIRLLKQVESLAIKNGVLSGIYVVDLDKPIASRQFNKAKKVISQKLLQFIQKTRLLDKSSFKPVTHQGRKVCRIGKFAKKSNKIYYSFTDVTWEDSPENINKVREMLQFAIDIKTKNLETKGETNPKVLLLLNTYPFVSQQVFRNCLAQITGMEFFHAIYIIR